MVRQPEREQLNRLTVKTLDQVFIMRGKERLDCSHSRLRPSPAWLLSLTDDKTAEHALGSLPG